MDQTSALAKASGTFIRINARMFYVLVLSLLHTSRIKEARDLLSQVPDDYGDDSIRNAKLFLATKDVIVKERERGGKASSIASICESLLWEYPDDRDLQFWYAESETAEVIRTGIDPPNLLLHILETRAHDGDFVKLRADIELSNGERRKAAESYKFAIANTKNGLTILLATDALNSLGWG